MKISLATHGGWAGLVTRPLTVDTDALPAAVAEQGLHLAAAAEAVPDPSASALAAARARAPEAMTYTVTIEDRDRVVTLKSSDMAAHPAVDALAAWVRSQARR